MGVILDSSVLIAPERQGNNARQMLTAVSSQLGNTEIALSVLALLELAHGAARADTLERKSMREQFIEELLTAAARSSCHGGNSFAHWTDRWSESSQRSAASAR